MDKLNAMQVFVQIAERGSLTAAAKALDSSLPAVVRTLAAPESELCVRLFNRTTRRIALTEEGKRYLASCKQILSAIEEVEAALTADTTAPSGHLTITAPVLFGQMYVAPSVTRLVQRYPALRCGVVLHDRVVNLLRKRASISVFASVRSRIRRSLHNRSAAFGVSWSPAPPSCVNTAYPNTRGICCRPIACALSGRAACGGIFAKAVAISMCRSAAISTSIWLPPRLMHVSRVWASVCSSRIRLRHLLRASSLKLCSKNSKHRRDRLILSIHMHVCYQHVHVYLSNG